MASAVDAMTELLERAGREGKVIRSWRITGVREGKASGSDCEDVWSEIQARVHTLPPGEYSLQVTESTKQEGWCYSKRFDVTEIESLQVRDEMVKVLRLELSERNKLIETLLTRNETLVKTLDDSASVHAKGIAATSEGISKILESNIKGLEALAEAHVNLLSSSKDILVATAQDARDESLKKQASGLLGKIFDPILGDVSDAVKNLLSEGLPLALQAGKWALRGLISAGEKSE